MTSIENIDLLSTIDPQHLPKNVRALLKKRDDAWSALCEHAASAHDLLSDGWLTTAEALDIKAAVDAVDAGKPVPEVGSQNVDRMRAERPKAIAVARKLRREVTTAEAALRRAYRAAAAELETAAKARLDEASKAAEDAYSAFQAACAAAGFAAGEVRHLRDWQSNGRSDAPTAGHLVRADGLTPSSMLGPVEALREVKRSYDVPFTPVKRVRVQRGDGVVVDLPEDQARAMVSSSNTNRDGKLRIIGDED